MSEGERSDDGCHQKDTIFSTFEVGDKGFVDCIFGELRIAPKKWWWWWWTEDPDERMELWLW